MSKQVLFDLGRIDPTHVEYSREQIRRFIPQRYEFEQLDGVFRVFPDEGFIVGFKDVREDEFWARGHIPGMPLLPGVLMIEAAAQLCAVYNAVVLPGEGFMGFGALDRVKFRAAVRPGDRLILIGKGVQVARRRSLFEAQGVVRDAVVLEAAITGVNIPASRAADGGKPADSPRP